MSENNGAKSELVVFGKLEVLCQSPGYIHVISYFCFRDNTVMYGDKMEAEDHIHLFSTGRLLRIEISTLIGLMCKKEIDEVPLSSDILQNFINKTESLLRKLHHSLMPKLEDIFLSDKLSVDKFNALSSGSVLRESIFYGGESAYNFQYRDLWAEKYSKDSDWLKRNKGFSISQAMTVVSAIEVLQRNKINNVLHTLVDNFAKETTLLGVYTFSLEDLLDETGLEPVVVKNIVEAFVSPLDQYDFESLDDFNPINAYPIIKLKNDRYILFQYYSLVEALYETPFYWLSSDKAYINTAMTHRGEFTEEFSFRRLKHVFGQSCVFKNIIVYDNKSNNVGEIDVLVVFGDRAIVLQAKSKRLTIAARKGNDCSLKHDFKEAVQVAYNQALSCSSFLINRSYKLLDGNGNEIAINRNLKEIFPFCVVSDHYPALSFQASQFLEQKPTNIIKPAFVMDIFFLDVATEMLSTPLYFLSYVNRRTFFSDKILFSNEMAVLAYHLKQNLWVESEYAMKHIADDFCASLDVAMLVRREGIPGNKTPDGILTMYKTTHFGKLIEDIELQNNAATLDLGFLLLKLSSDTIETINGGITKLIELGKDDGKNHDLTLIICEDGSGLTIHCNDNSLGEAAKLLNRHCELRKYKHKANRWFGICICPKSGRLRFGTNKDYLWSKSDELDNLTKKLRKPQSLKVNRKINFQTKLNHSEKVGRNEKCPCGSGKKYKKCCLILNS